MPRLLTVAPYRVWPPTSGASLLIDGASRAVARHGWEVRIFSSGVRRGSLLRDLRPASHAVAPGYTVYNEASPWSVLLGLGSRQSTGLPPLAADRVLRWLRPAVLRRWLAEADVVQVEGPFAFAAVAELAPAAIPRVLVCHNVEGRLYADTLAHRPHTVREIRARERAAATAADALIALTSADRDTLASDYGVAPERVHVIPCGVDLQAFAPASEAARAAAKQALGLAGRTVAVFTGARYGPNIEAVRYLERMAASGALPPDLALLVVGRVGEVAEPRPNLRLTGFVADVAPCLAAADLAVVPMRSGGGMHLKVLEFLACGLPVVATPLGLRGLERPLPEGVVACRPEQVPEALAAWTADPAAREAAGRANRDWVAARYGWDRIGERRVALYRRLLGPRA